MTIKEVEDLLGIGREAVRYYIHEGLASPRQDAKMYRIYTDEDIKQLERVLILRQLEVGIADIKDLFDGELALQDILEECKEEIRQKQIILNDAAIICEKLMDTGAGAYFDPEPYFINYPKVFKEERENQS